MSGSLYMRRGSVPSWCREHELDAHLELLMFRLLDMTDWKTRSIGFTYMDLAKKLGYPPASGRRTLRLRLERLESLGAIRVETPLNANSPGQITWLLWDRFVTSGQPKFQRAPEAGKVGRDQGGRVPEVVEVVKDTSSSSTQPGRDDDDGAFGQLTKAIEDRTGAGLWGAPAERLKRLAATANGNLPALLARVRTSQARFPGRIVEDLEAAAATGHASVPVAAWSDDPRIVELRTRERELENLERVADVDPAELDELRAIVAELRGEGAEHTAVEGRL